jgi:hypothetical protein
VSVRRIRSYQTRVLLQPEICEAIIVNITGSHVETLPHLLKGALVQSFYVDVIDGVLRALVTFNLESLGYYPENQNWDGKFRKIQIVAQQSYKVYARKGYYAHPRYQAMR